VYFCSVDLTRRALADERESFELPPARSTVRAIEAAEVSDPFAGRDPFDP
jgi:hypothetical protein